MSQFSPVMNVMIQTVRKATRSLLRDFNEVAQLQASRKAPGDFVTIADKRTEELIYYELLKARPDYGFLMEEQGEVGNPDAEYRWIIDPLDGTTNFLHSLPYFAVSIALEQRLPNGKREIIAAVTEAPILKETFWAEKNKGVWFENTDGSRYRLRIANRKEVDQALICVGSLRHDIDHARSLHSKAAAIRCLGSTTLALAYFAAGKMDVFIQNQVAPWDIAAGILFCQEAGGIVIDTKGGSNMMQEGSIIATNAFLLEYIKSSFLK